MNTSPNPPSVCRPAQLVVAGVEAGVPGQPGESAYEIWVRNGGVGTVSDFLTSLQGGRGRQGPQGAAGLPGQLPNPLPPIPAGLDGGIRPIAFFTGAQFSAPDIGRASDNLLLVSSSRTLELGRVPCASGSYLLQLNLQIAWTQAPSADLNGRCWLQQGGVIIATFDWARLKRGTDGYSYGTITSLNQSVLVNLVQGEALTLVANPAFYLVGGSAIAFNRPLTYQPVQPAIPPTNSFSMFRLEFEWFNYNGELGAVDYGAPVRLVSFNPGTPTEFPPAMTGPETPSPYSASALAEFEDYAAWQAFQGAVSDSGWNYVIDSTHTGGFTADMRRNTPTWIQLNTDVLKSAVGLRLVGERIIRDGAGDLIGASSTATPVSLVLRGSNDGFSWSPVWRNTNLALPADVNIAYDVTYSFLYRYIFLSGTGSVSELQFQDGDGEWITPLNFIPDSATMFGGLALDLGIARRWLAIRMKGAEPTAPTTVLVNLNANSSLAHPINSAGDCCCGQIRNLAGGWGSSWRTFNLLNLPATYEP